MYDTVVVSSYHCLSCVNVDFRWFRDCKTFVSGVCSGGVTLFYLGIAGLMFTVSLVSFCIVMYKPFVFILYCDSLSEILQMSNVEAV